MRTESFSAMQHAACKAVWKSNRGVIHAKAFRTLSWYSGTEWLKAAIQTLAFEPRTLLNWL